jgi:diguanylate cyclase (GGDEF)-like protein/PAS domain S-box-containing protein
MVDQRRPALRDYLTLLERVPETFSRAWDAIAIYDLEGRLIAGNPAAHALVGEDFAVALRGGHFTEHLALDVARQSARSFAECATSGNAVEVESLMRDARGASIPVRVRLVPARFDGAIVGVIGFARDMRAVRAAESQFMRAEQQFRALFESHPDALSMHDLDGRYLRINASLTRLCGYEARDLIGETPAMLSRESAAELPTVLAAVKRGETLALERAIRVKDGSTLDVSVLAVPLVIDEAVRGYCAIVRDVTEQRRRERDAERAAKRIGDLYQIAAASTMSSDDKVTTALDRARIELDASWAYVGHFHDGMMEITHASGEAEIGFPVGFTAPIACTIAAHVRDADVLVVSDLARSPFRAMLDGRRAGWHSYIGVPLSVNGERYGVIGVLSNARALELSATDGDYVRAIGALIASAVQQGAREKRLDTLAFHDALTGLPNRALFSDRLERALLAARRNRRSFAVHYVDIDRFKAVNDTYGHHTGDGVLVAVADWLLSHLRDSDTVARIGGDEFVVLQPEIDSAQQAEDVAARLVTIRDAPLQVGEFAVPVRLSIGVAVYPADGSNTIDMLRAADTQLYGVKNGGRDGYAIHTV